MKGNCLGILSRSKKDGIYKLFLFVNPQVILSKKRFDKMSRRTVVRRLKLYPISLIIEKFFVSAVAPLK